MHNSNVTLTPVVLVLYGHKRYTVSFNNKCRYYHCNFTYIFFLLFSTTSNC